MDRLCSKHTNVGKEEVNDMICQGVMFVERVEYPRSHTQAITWTHHETRTRAIWGRAADENSANGDRKMCQSHYRRGHQPS